MSFECEYCKNNFSSKSNLNNHQKNTQYCLQLRNPKKIKKTKQDKNIEENKRKFECNGCYKTFTSKQSLNYHTDRCKQFYIYQNNLKKIEDQKEQIKELQTTISKLCEKAIDKPTIDNTKNNSVVNNNTNNNTNNNLLYNNVQSVNLSPEHVEKVFDENLSLKDLYKGKKGYLEFLVKNFLTDDKGNYIAWCPDYSRKVIKYKDQNEEIVKDINGYNIINNTSPLIESKGREITKKFKNTYYTYDDDGNFINKTEEELSEEEKENEERDKFYDPEEEEEDEDEKIEKVKNKMLNKVSKIIQEIKGYKNNYNPEKIDFYFDRLVKSLEEFAEINESVVNISKDLIQILPDQPKRKSKYSYDGEKTTKFNFDPEKI